MLEIDYIVFQDHRVFAVLLSINGQVLYAAYLTRFAFFQAILSLN